MRGNSAGPIFGPSIRRCGGGGPAGRLHPAAGTAAVARRLEQMRENAAGQIRREDVVRRLAQLAFGRANDAVALALRGGEPEGLELSAVSEFRVTDKGGVEVKLVDRVRALEALWELLGDSGGTGAEELYQALEGSGGWEEE